MREISMPKEMDYQSYYNKYYHHPVPKHWERVA